MPDTRIVPSLDELQAARDATGGHEENDPPVRAFEAMCRRYVEAMLDRDWRVGSSPGVAIAPSPVGVRTPNRIPFEPPNPDRPR
jgi:hypothetical protein